MASFGFALIQQNTYVMNGTLLKDHLILNAITFNFMLLADTIKEKYKKKFQFIFMVQCNLSFTATILYNEKWP